MIVIADFMGIEVYGSTFEYILGFLIAVAAT